LHDFGGAQPELLTNLRYSREQPLFVSVTRLRVRSFWDLPAFVWMTFRTQRQTAGAAGFLGGKLLVDKRRTFWTLTAWQNEKTMKAFRGSGPHAMAMPKLVEWCDEAAYTHWTTTENSLPEWPQAHEILVKEGRLSRVARPSQDHTARHFPEPRLQPLIAQNLKPVKS
jgi:heme-degrading monooxygenase HmoA